MKENKKSNTIVTNRDGKRGGGGGGGGEGMLKLRNRGCTHIFYCKNTVFCSSLNILNLFGELSLVYS